MTEPDDPSFRALQRGLALLQTVQRASTLEDAHAEIVTTTRELTKADHAFLIERLASGKLAIIRHDGAGEPSPAAKHAALADAEAALDRHASRKKKAAETGRDVRNLGTDEEVPLSSVAKALWSDDRLFGVVAIIKDGPVDFSRAERAHFSSLAGQAAAGLAMRYVRPPARDERLEAEKKRVGTQRIGRARLDAIGELAGKTFVGEGKSYRETLELIERYAGTNLTVLILGESGTGKERVARLMHDAGPRSKGPFVPVNVAAISPALFDSLLAGHRKGAFTGADRAEKGLMRAADGGTIFLDEAGELALERQTKLLRMIQERKVLPVGETEEISVDVRIIAATNVALEQAVADGDFRQDLYYRLRELTLKLLPLRDRLAELPVFLDHILRATAGKASARTFLPEALDALRAHDWPGNFRELENVVKSAAVRAGKDGPIEARHLEIRPRLMAKAPRREPLTRAKVERALEANGGNHAEAARVLGVNRRSIFRLLGGK